MGPVRDFLGTKHIDTESQSGTCHWPSMALNLVCLEVRPTPKRIFLHGEHNENGDLIGKMMMMMMKMKRWEIGCDLNCYLGTLRLHFRPQNLWSSMQAEPFSKITCTPSDLYVAQSCMVQHGALLGHIWTYQDTTNKNALPTLELIEY